MRRSCALVLSLAACAPPVADVQAVFAPEGSGFFSTPFPADARRGEDGRPDWRSFPNPAGLTLFDSFLERASSMDGFGFNAPIWLRFEAPLDARLLPAPEDSLSEDSGLQLIDITPSSPEFGMRTPVHWELREQPGAYVPPNLLAVAPVAGWPLRPRTTYALVVTTDVALPSEDWTDLWEDPDRSGAWADSLATLRAALPAVGLDPARIAVATTFTTADPFDDLETIARFLNTRVTPPVFTEALEHRYDLANYRLYRSNYTTPMFMSGDKPYAEEGGAFVFRDDGLPVIQGWDPMRLSVSVPAAGTAPEAGWPVVVYLHGTGGDYRTFANEDDSFEPAAWMADMGAVGLGIDLPLHGPRGTSNTNIELHSFNVLQPDSALHMHRQAAADVLYLIQGLATSATTFRTPEGQTVRLDPSRIVVVGHSQGGITAALALPWLGSRVQGAVLSGTGGLLAITAVEREATVDFPTLIKSLLEFDEDEALTELHPVLGLIQTLVEPTDPINYARGWFHEDMGLSAAAPVPVLLTTGLQDAQTPTRTSEALASAAHMPFAGKQRTDAPGLSLRGFASTSLPLRDNVTDWSGAALTAGFSQWRNGDHFVIFRDSAARDIVRQFVASSLRDKPQIANKVPSPLSE